MSWKKLKLEHLFLSLLLLQAVINLIGVFGPELGFDALWYHLTEAKLFLQRRSLAPIPGNLLYWSGLPRLGELIYSLALGVADERLTKFIHWSAGLVCAWLVYRLGRKKFSRTSSLAASLLFYSTLLVGWLSTTSYVDLIFTAFFLAALVTNKKTWRAVWLILAGATKLQAIPYNLALLWVPWSVLGALPFWLVNWRTTGNFFYPFFENFGFEKEYFFNGFWFWFSRPLRLFFDPQFFVGPLILILALLSLRRPSKPPPLPPYTLLLIFLAWWFGPGTDFGRFALVPLALLCVVASRCLNQSLFSKWAVALILLQAVVGIGGRAWANQKYLPFIFKQETKSEFLVKHLNFDFGDFYDLDGFFQKKLKPSDRVLVYNIHNLYYLDFNYDHESWADPNTVYSYILVGDGESLPQKFSPLPLIYQNKQSLVKLYRYESTD
jgi:hypothetical protein